jgi:hypothetical protein
MAARERIRIHILFAPVHQLTVWNRKFGASARCRTGWNLCYVVSLDTAAFQ